MKNLSLLVVIGLVLFVHSIRGMTNYEYFAPDGSVQSGLTASGSSFTLNGKDITIFSGAFHYFRVHPQYWRDTLQKLRAAGLNTVETYMAWNLHNPQKDVYDFGSLGSDMSEFLDIRQFIQIAQEEDLFVILRPGPFICAEWDFGGMPSWLLRDYTMNLRTMYDGYTSSIVGFYQNLSAQVNDLLFQQGGPIIAVQIENEYGHFGYDDQPRDKMYLQFIKQLFDDNGFSDELYFTSDSPADTKDWGGLPGILMTANYQNEVSENLDMLKTLQPNKPLMTMEFWSGWFDHWLAELHVTRSTELINSFLTELLNKNSSVNFYMFIGGTNFGFMAGANQIEVFPFYAPITTSYDYDAPLTEAGDYSDKYDAFASTIQLYDPLSSIIDTPARPAERTKKAYSSVAIGDYIEFQDLIQLFPDQLIATNGPINMESLDINNRNGQSYGYTVYTTTVDLPAGESTILIRGHVRDMAQVIVDGEVVTKQYRFQTDLNNFGFWNGLDQSLNFTSSGGSSELSIMVENLGRVNYGRPHYFHQKKGLWEGPVLINNVETLQWTITPMEFKRSFVSTSLTGWTTYQGTRANPSVYRATIPLIPGDVFDTFLDMSDWGKGVVFVNGFNLGRYWSTGPTKTLYCPAPLLKVGDNEFVIFEQYSSSDTLVFTDVPKLGLLGA